MSEQDKSPFEQMAESFFGQAAEYIKKTMDDIKAGAESASGGSGGGKPADDDPKATEGTPPPEPKSKSEPKDDKPAPKRHFWFGEIS